jgi:prepilin-type N-terminal cleavage/methylation domain-containing protein
MRTRAAFTLVEVLVVIGILAVLAALTFPVFGLAKAKARETACASNLRQIWLATQLYRSENGGDGVYGSVTAMGLPNATEVRFFTDLRRQGLVCGLGNRPLDPLFGNTYYRMFQEDEGDPDPWKWSAYTTSKHDEAILMADPFHNPPDVSIELSPLRTKVGFGVTLGGNVRRVENKGDWMFRAWWHH